MKVFLPEEEDKVTEIKIIDGSDSGYFLKLDLGKEFDASLGLLDKYVDLKIGFKVIQDGERRYLNVYPKILAQLYGEDLDDDNPRDEINEALKNVKKRVLLRLCQLNIKLRWKNLRKKKLINLLTRWVKLKDLKSLIELMKSISQ